MASQRFTLPVVLSILEIPLPEDDDMSVNEFDGYTDLDKVSADGSDAAYGKMVNLMKTYQPMLDF